MKKWMQTFKPRSSSRFQLFLAASMWSAVGSGLLIAGYRWTGEGSDMPLRLFLVAAGVLAGMAKGMFLLDRTAAKIVRRIEERGEGNCVGGFLSLRSWMLVVAMVVAGRFLRSGLLPLAAAGTLYVAIGTGLLFSSRLAWRRWRSLS